MIIAYTRTYSNKQQSDNQKNAIEQFAANNNMTIDKWHKDSRSTSSRHKNRLEEIIKTFLRIEKSPFSIASVLHFCYSYGNT